MRGCVDARVDAYGRRWTPADVAGRSSARGMGAGCPARARDEGCVGTPREQGLRGRAAGIRTRDLCLPKASRPDLGARRRTNPQVRRVRGHHRTGVDDPSRGMGAGWSGSLLRMSRVDLIRREPFGAPLASSPRAARFGLRAGKALEDHRDIDCRDLLAALGPSALAAGMRRMMTRGKGDELRRSCCVSRQAG